MEHKLEVHIWSREHIQSLEGDVIGSHYSMRPVAIGYASGILDIHINIGLLNNFNPDISRYELILKEIK